METNKKEDTQDYQALFEELEARYGAAAAQEIIDQIKKVEDQDNDPDYLSVKALSEILEAFRTEAVAKVNKLRNAPTEVYKGSVAYLDTKRLEQDFNHLWQCYRITQKAYYRLIRKAIKQCETPFPYRYNRQSKPTEMKIAA